MVTVAVAIVLAVVSLAAIAIQLQTEGEAGRAPSGEVGEQLIVPESMATVEEPLTPQESPESTATSGPPAVATFPPVSDSAIVSLSITTAVVEATSFEVASLAADGTLELPTDAEVVFYYEFGARLGDTAGNVVLGGDSFRTPEVESALANLGAARISDRIVIELADGTVYVYQVFAISTLPGRSATLENVGCTAEGCSGLGTLNLLGYRALAESGQQQSGTLVVLAQLLRGGP